MGESNPYCAPFVTGQTWSCRSSLGHQPSCIVLVPVKGEVQYCGRRPLIEYTLERALESKYIKEVIVSTDNEALAEVARNAGAKVPFLRTQDLSREFIDMRTVLQYSLKRLEEMGYMADVIVVLEVTYPFRRKGFLDSLIEKFVRDGSDSLVPVCPEYRSAWIKEGKKVDMVIRLMPRSLKEECIYISLFGLGFITYPKFIRDGTLIDNNIGIYEVTDNYSALEVRGRDSIELAGTIIDKYWRGMGSDSIYKAP